MDIEPGSELKSSSSSSSISFTRSRCRELLCKVQFDGVPFLVSNGAQRLMQYTWYSRAAFCALSNYRQQQETELAL